MICGVDQKLDSQSRALNRKEEYHQRLGKALKLLLKDQEEQIVQMSHNRLWEIVRQTEIRAD